MPANVPVPHYLDLLGDPFERGARGPATWDCYGLVKELYGRAGVIIPDFESPGTVEEVAQIIADESRRWRRVPIGTVGVLHTFRVESVGAHVGFTIDSQRFIHAVDPVVTTSRLIGAGYTPLAAYDYV